MRNIVIFVLDLFTFQILPTRPLAMKIKHQKAVLCKMNEQNFALCRALIPPSYVNQAQNARKTIENEIRVFLEHVSC